MCSRFTNQRAQERSPTAPQETPSKILCAAAVVIAFTLLAPPPAAATVTVGPITWNVIGLDSNSPSAGPNHFPVGARICSNVATTGVSVVWSWDSANANINLRPGSLSTITIPSIGAGACADAYFEVEVTQVPAAYDTTRRYHITATDFSGTVSSRTPRELYVEHLISQNRNSTTGVKLKEIEARERSGILRTKLSPAAPGPQRSQILITDRLVIEARAGRALGSRWPSGPAEG